MPHLISSSRPTAAQRTLLLLVCLVAPAWAQDVTITDPDWAQSFDSPDQLPALKKKPTIAFPAELKATSEVGYVLFENIVDKRGQVLASRPHSTWQAFERALLAMKSSFVWLPGKRDGESVNTEFTFAVIFNPASAAPTGSEATPRLLKVALAKLPPKSKEKDQDAPPERVEWVDVTVDETGRIKELKNAPADAARACELAAKQWRFAPARRDGVAIASTVRVPFVIGPERGASGPSGGKLTVPRVIRQGSPFYPFAMRESGMRGEVLVDFLVDIEGRVRNPYVVRTLNPAFNDSAIAAVRDWKFEPGTKDGRPVVVHMQVPVVYLITDERGGGAGPFRRKSQGDLARLPEEFRYDAPPKPIGTSRVIYPYALLQAGKTGKATVQFVVEPDGRVANVQVVAADHAEFGLAVKTAVEGFLFEPAIKAGRPGRSLESFTQEFDSYERRQVVSRAELFMLMREQKKPETITGELELDERPAAISRAPTKFPQGLPADLKSGEAMVEFIIDEEGTPRLPRVVTATHPAFGFAAVQSVVNWRFAIPKVGCRPTAARVRMPVAFGEAKREPGDPATSGNGAAADGRND